MTILELQGLWRKSKFLSKGFIFTALSFLAVAALNYALYPAIVRILDVAFLGSSRRCFCALLPKLEALFAFNVVSDCSCSTIR